jgi:tetratricopeptide (TPR) repeat protein
MYFVRLFPNLEQMKKFLSKSYPKELLLLEKENDNDSESAETYLKLFAYEEAAACYLKANNYQEALSCHVRLLRSQICPCML